MSMLKVARGNRKAFDDAINIDKDTLYFILDTQEIYLGNVKMADGRIDMESGNVVIDKYKTVYGGM